MKRIGIDARFWGEAGPGRYAACLVRELEKIDTKNKYFIFLTSRGFKDYTPSNKNFTKVLADYRWYSLAEQFKYPKLLYKYKLDLLHFAQFNMPLLYLKPFTVTIHDMILHDYPIKKGGFKNKFLYPVKRLGYLAIFWWAAKASKAIVVPSKDAKTDLTSRLRVPADRITVTYEGFDNSLKSKILGPDFKVLEKYNIKSPYILFVGSMYPHKNLERLVEAFAKLNSKMNLVLVGKESFFSQRLRQKVEKLGLNNLVLFPGLKAKDGYVPDEDLPHFYKNAAAFVFPSLKEGFGIPPLEAMAFSIPIAASNLSCVPEICGDAALYFDPKNPSDIANKIEEILTNEKLRKELIAKGKTNLKRFSWTDMAKKTLSVFESIFMKFS